MPNSAEGRLIESDGPSVQRTSNDNTVGGQGSNIRSERILTQDDNIVVVKTTEDGTHTILSDRTIQIAAGGKGKEGDIDVTISSKNGDLALTCQNNGIVRIKGASIMLESDEDITISSGRNLNLKGKEAVNLDGVSIDMKGLKGNLVEKIGSSFFQQVTGPLQIMSKRSDVVKGLLDTFNPFN
jgi:hypothetical protein|tara:strand:- start:342 stop:890 length:549 start_codon:yes stop_codon:yes gene_type:complete